MLCVLALRPFSVQAVKPETRLTPQFATFIRQPLQHDWRDTGEGGAPGYVCMNLGMYVCIYLYTDVHTCVNWSQIARLHLGLLGVVWNSRRSKGHFGMWRNEKICSPTLSCMFCGARGLHVTVSSVSAPQIVDILGVTRGVSYRALIAAWSKFWT